ncbi:Peptidoglycan-binding domain 1 protein [Calothrix sp. PCC 6303]|nr:Peptidoglycan-binding domain 1 protein [Calothrix sp. PCC 6303]
MNYKIKSGKISYLKSFSLLPKSSVRKFQSLIILTSTPLLLATPSVAETTSTQQIAQVISTGSIKRPNLAPGSQGESVSELQAALKFLGFYDGAVDGIYSDATAAGVSKFKQAAGLKVDNTVDAATWQRLFPGEATIVNANSGLTSPTPFPSPTQTTRNQQSRNSEVAVKPVTSNQKKTPQPMETVRPVTTNRNQQKTGSAQNSTSNRSRQTASSSTNRTSKTTFTPKPGIQYTVGGMPILRIGMRGSEVTQAQQHLKRLGYLAANPDGDFGTETEVAVKALQKRFGLEADGIVGGETWELLTRRRK